MRVWGRRNLLLHGDCGRQSALNIGVRVGRIGIGVLSLNNEFCPPGGIIVRVLQNHGRSDIPIDEHRCYLADRAIHDVAVPRPAFHGRREDLYPISILVLEAVFKVDIGVAARDLYGCFLSSIQPRMYSATNRREPARL